MWKDTLLNPSGRQVLLQTLTNFVFWEKKNYYQHCWYFSRLLREYGLAKGRRQSNIQVCNQHFWKAYLAFGQNNFFQKFLCWAQRNATEQSNIGYWKRFVPFVNGKRYNKQHVQLFSPEPHFIWNQTTQPRMVKAACSNISQRYKTFVHFLKENLPFLFLLSQQNTMLPVFPLLLFAKLYFF